MKTVKILFALLLAIAGVFALTLPAFAAVPMQDGAYAVPVMLYHSEKDKESMGNKYILPTALLTVSGGKKTITVVADGVDNLTFSYYLNGSVEGETAQAETVSDVTIDGKTYEAGFAFPLVTNNDYVGVKFKAPIMPMSPSARLKIDYSGAKLLAAAATEAPVTAQPAASPETSAAPATTAAPQATAKAQPSAEARTTLPASPAAEPAASPAEIPETAAETSAAGSTAPQTAETAGSFPLIPVIACAAVAAAAALVVILKRKK